MKSGIIAIAIEAVEFADLGTISLKSSIFSLPAGVSPIFMSINTTGRVLEDILSEDAVGSVQIEEEAPPTATNALRHQRPCLISFPIFRLVGTSTRPSNPKKTVLLSCALVTIGMASA